MEFITHKQDKENKTYLYCILQYVDDKVWIKLEEPCLYEDFVREGFFSQFFFLFPSIS